MRACTRDWARQALSLAAGRLDRLDPGARRRIKGLRLVTAYGIAAMLGTMPDIAAGLPDAAALPWLAGGFALWGSVSEARATRAESSRDLVILALAAGIGAAIFAVLGPLLRGLGHAGPELVLVTGAFCVGYGRRFGITGTGVGSQLYIGQLLAYGSGLGTAQLPTIAVATLLAAVAGVVPRVLSGPAEQPPPAATPSGVRRRWPDPETAMGLQAALAALVIIALNEAAWLLESAWAITAATYVVAGSSAGTIDRVRRRIVGTVIGVPVGLAFLPLVTTAPLLAWGVAALAMVIYAMALPERYDIACGAYAVTLILTLAVGGEHSVMVLGARAWETLLGGALGMAAALLVFPLREPAPA